MAGAAAGPVLDRRTLLAALLLAPPVLAACSPATAPRDEGPDPLIAMADAARSDAALAAAVVAATPDLAIRVNPLRDARTRHADALDAEVARRAGSTATPRPTPGAAPPPAAGATLPALRQAVGDSARAASAAVLTLPADRAGLVASVAACCTTYAGVLG